MFHRLRLFHDLRGPGAGTRRAATRDGRRAPSLGSHVVTAFALSFLLVGCGDATPTDPAPDRGQGSADARGNALNPTARADAPTPAIDAPGAPTPIHFSNTFPGQDACTGEPQVVTISGVIWLHELSGGVRLLRWERTITTDTGYEGRGVRTVVDNGNVFKLTNNDVVSHPDGRKFLAHGVMVLDLSAEPPSPRVEMGGFRCIKG